MQSHLLTEILKGPFDPDIKDMHLLEELCSKYPYCQTIQIILAKCYQKNNITKFEKQVNLASAYSIDRRQFQNYISEKNRDTQATSKNEETYYLNPNENNSQQNINTQPEGEIISPASNKQKNINKNPAGETKDLSNAGDRKKQLEQIVRNRLKSFNDQKQEEDQKSPVIPAGSKNPENKNITRNTSKYDELIDRFIREEPRIKAKKNTSSEEEKKEEDLSEKSVKFKDDIISETLAEIYLKQGRINQALDIYYRLSLKFPEKSSYFAKKIEQVKNNHIT